jgi:protein phosphatase
MSPARMTSSGAEPSVGIATHVGRVRTHNEDAVRAEGAVFVVADGMGGHAAGEVASRLATEALVELADRGSLEVRDVVAQVGEANRRILESASRHPEQYGMGTTITGVAVVQVGGVPHWAVFNVGDSRVYRCVDGRLSQVTVDHSEVQELVERGYLTVEQAARHPARNIVTRSLGREPMAAVDTWVFPPYAGERLVICSDGLSNELALEEIESVVSATDDAQEAATILVDQAVAAGGRDNVTAIVIAIPGGQGPESDVDEDTTPRDTMNRGSSLT